MDAGEALTRLGIALAGVGSPVRRSADGGCGPAGGWRRGAGPARPKGRTWPHASSRIVASRLAHWLWLVLACTSWGLTHAAKQQEERDQGLKVGETQGVGKLRPHWDNSSDSNSTASDSEVLQSDGEGEGHPLLYKSDSDELEEVTAPPTVVTQPWADAAPDVSSDAWAAAASEQGMFCITGANITSFWSTLAVLKGLQGDILALQEHGIPERSLDAAQAVAHQHGFTLVAGPQDETGHSGVAVLTRRPARAQEDECRSEEGRNARALGRLLIVRVDMPSGIPVIIITILLERSR